MEHLLGVLVTIFGISMFIIGMGHQIWKHYKEKRFGLSSVWAVLGIATSATRIPYLALKGAWWALVPDVIGLLLSIIIIYQYGAYARGWWGTHKAPDS